MPQWKGEMLHIKASLCESQRGTVGYLKFEMNLTTPENMSRRIVAQTLPKYP